MPNDVAQASAPEQETTVGEHITDDDPLHSRHRNDKGGSHGGKSNIHCSIEWAYGDSETHDEGREPAVTVWRDIATRPYCRAPHAVFHTPAVLDSLHPFLPATLTQPEPYQHANKEQEQDIGQHQEVRDQE